MELKYIERYLTISINKEELVKYNSNLKNLIEKIDENKDIDITKEIESLKALNLEFSKIISNSRG